MYLTRRNLIAWVLLLLAAGACTLGDRYLHNTHANPVETTMPIEASVHIAESTYSMETTNAAGEANTGHPTTNPAVNDDAQSSYSEPALRPTGEDGSGVRNSRLLQMLAWLLLFAGVAAGFVSVFILRQEAPLLGPDGAALLVAVVAEMGLFPQLPGREYLGFLDIFFSAAVVLLSLREAYGWLRSKLRGDWCAVYRLSSACKAPQISLSVYAFWICAAMIAGVKVLSRWDAGDTVTVLGLFAAGICGMCCLWRYGSDLRHFQKQLENYRNGAPVTVKEGAFSQTELWLLEIQAQHEEAVKTAVTSERFKVELISNVSHDLRTPLTSILGYSELLRTEVMTDSGKEQLERLTQKAGYMRDLVDSLFELTKVSSGVLESRQDRIDLIRLLEQTIGLFDDQLLSAGVTVRRHYCADSLCVITDGARMHQVFANLLGNAIKYALADTRIHLEVTEQSEHIRIRMVNTASYEMDFSPEEITQRFVRGDKARTTGGSGLGLAIAQTYTESVGGQFHVEVDGDQFGAIVRLPKNERNL